ncbi:hypothetical protein AALB51_16845 [Lachnospiraceae bacterium 62-26]
MTFKEREDLGLRSDEQDEELIKEIVKILRERELSFDRASRVLADAQAMLPYIAKLALV